jgi:hypothetical protein
MARIVTYLTQEGRIGVVARACGAACFVHPSLVNEPCDSIPESSVGSFLLPLP